MPTSCSHYFVETIRGAKRAGVDTDLLLTNVGLTCEQVFDPYWRGDVELLARLIQLLWFTLNDEFMGFISRPAKLGTFAMMTHCIMDAHSLESAMRKGILFYDLFTDGLRMSLEKQGNEACFSVEFKNPGTGSGALLPRVLADDLVPAGRLARRRVASADAGHLCLSETRKIHRRVQAHVPVRLRLRRPRKPPCISMPDSCSSR